MEKKNVLVMLGFMLLSATGLFAQSANIAMKDTQAPMVVWLSDSKTTNFVFPYGIKSVDKGSKDILVQKASSVENVLQAKAAKHGFIETNLTVITADGQMYSFIIKYALQPPLMNIRFEPGGSEKPVVQFSEETDNEQQLKNTAERVAAKFTSMNTLRAKKFSISFKVNGIYIQDDAYYFQIRLENNSNVNYSIDQLRMFIRDKKQSKRTASQEIELTPIGSFGNLKQIDSRSAQTVVVSVSKFTIPEQKEMILQLQEGSGGRHLKLEITNKMLLSAKSL